MSIATRTGDKGLTGLMYNRRVAKTDARIEACGALDELNSALGMARATAGHAIISEQLLPVQQDLITLMGEVATLPEDKERYLKDGFLLFTEAATCKLDEIIATIEAQNVSFRGWATPGDNLNSATLDLARSVCRRAERDVIRALGESVNPAILIYLNRLSDTLWLLARWGENQPTARSEQS